MFWAALLCGVAVFGVSASGGHAVAAPSYVDAYDLHGPEELILSVTMTPYVLSDGVLAYQENGRFYVPVVTMANVFDFAVDADLGQGVVTGWAIDESHSFVIDSARGQVVANGRNMGLEAGDILTGDGVNGTDLYVDVSVLNTIWPVTIHVDMAALSLNVSADAPLPFMQRAEREGRRAAQMGAAPQHDAVDPNQPVIETPYKLFSLPVVDIDTEWGYDSTKTGVDASVRLSGVNDLGFFQADYAATFRHRAGRFENPDAVRLRFSRLAQGSESLFAGVRQVEWGDTRARYSPLIENGLSGRGISISSTDRVAETAYDMTTIEGVETPGWEVEVYRNGELLGFQVVDARGEYRFDNIPLNFGNNRIRLVFYGPQGQMRERVENYTFGADMIAPGDVAYHFSALDANRDFIPVSSRKSNGQPEGGTYSARASYGVARGLTIYGTAARLPTRNNDTRDYISSGAALSTPVGVVQAEAYRDIGGGHAVDVRFNTAWSGFNVGLRASLYNNFESPQAGFGDAALTRDYEAEIGRVFRLPFGLLNITLNAQDEEDRSGERRTTYSTRQSFSFAGVRLGHSTHTMLNNRAHTNTMGQITANVRRDNWLLRSQLDYNAFPAWDMVYAQNELRYTSPDGFFTAFQANRDLQQSKTTLGLQVGYDFKTFLGSIDGRWIDGDGVSVLLRASTSLAPYGANDSYKMASERMSAMAAVRGRAFLDENADGVWNDNEPPVQNARFMVGGYPGVERTGEDGAAMNVVQPYRPISVRVDDASLDDPYYRSGHAGLRVFMRPGVVPAFDFPVITTGVIEGAITRADQTPVQGIQLELVNLDGVVMMTTRSAYDGYYVFEFVPPGDYVVRADPAHGVDVLPRPVTIARGDMFPGGVDLRLESNGL